MESVRKVDGVDRAMTRQVRCAWETYAVTELGMSAGTALRAFDNWRDSHRPPITDAQVDAALTAFYAGSLDTFNQDRMRAALEAARDAS